MILHLLLAIALGPSQRPLDLAKRYLRPGHHFIVAAHRGDHLEIPENTLAAYEEASKDDADFGETDLRLTKDGVIVLMHDETVDRTTDGHGKVEDLTFAEIRKLHIKGASEPTIVPTFEELLDRIKGGKLNIYMDIKAVHPQQVMPLLDKYGMRDNVIAYVYSPEQCTEWLKGAPGIPVISDLDAMKSTDQIEKDWSIAKFQITDGDAFAYTQEFVDKWHALGVAVVPDIQNPLESPEQWSKLINLGADGLQTDHPKQLIAYLKQLGIR